MKYFTPEHWLRLQDTSDNSAWLAAYQDWEKGVETYWAEVRELLARLPRQRWAQGIRQFFKQGSLHDASITACWYEGSDKLKVQVQPELPEKRLILLEYTLVHDPDVIRNSLPREYWGGRLEWMYDELRILPDASEGEDKVFAHNILLSNGWELILTFSRLKVTRCQALWPVSNDEGTPPTAPLPQMV